MRRSVATCLGSCRRLRGWVPAFARARTNLKLFGLKENHREIDLKKRGACRVRKVRTSGAANMHFLSSTLQAAPTDLRAACPPPPHRLCASLLLISIGSYRVFFAQHQILSFVVVFFKVVLSFFCFVFCFVLFK